MTTVTDAEVSPVASDSQSFLLRRVQPALSGLMDGSLSTLAPIFAVAFATHRPRYAFLAGLATAIGSGVSMALTRRGYPAHPPRRSCAAVWRTSATKHWTMAGFLRT